MNINAAIAAANASNTPCGPQNASSTSSAFSAVSWSAIFAGTVAAAALSLILLILGIGLCLSAVSPWTPSCISASTFGVSAVVWVTATQLIASGLGGYLAGWLRGKWISVPNDEVCFRDTVHGFLAWWVAFVVTAALLDSTTGAIVNSGVQAGAVVAGTAATEAINAMAAGVAASDKTGMSVGNAGNYFVDSLFCKEVASASTSTQTVSAGTESSLVAASAAEVTRIFVNSIRSDILPPEDKRCAAQVVAQRTGLSQADPEKRVNEMFARMQIKLRDAEKVISEATEKTRKASAYTALWVFISLLKELVPEATVEHATLKDLITQIENVHPDGEMFDAKVKVLSECVKHHVKEEQNEMFPQARATKLDMVELGAQLLSRKDELMAMQARPTLVC